MEKLEQFRAKMRERGMDAYLLPTGDPHFSEYTAEHWKARQWLSGFTGSAGTLAVTLKEAALWTDSRYFIQAGLQLEGSGIGLQKLGEETTPSPEYWLNERIEKGAVIGLDGRLISHAEFEALKRKIPQAEFAMQRDLIDEVWSDRPTLPIRPVWPMPEALSGQTVAEKRNRISAACGFEPYLICALDEVAWLCNMRGSDIAYNPVCTAYAIVEKEQIQLFAENRKFTDSHREALSAEQVVLHPYEALSDFCERYRGRRLLFNPSKTNEYIYKSLSERGVDCVPEPFPFSPVALPKACKTKAEVEGFKKAMLEDGIAWVKVLFWVDRMLQANQRLTEVRIAHAFADVRKEVCPEYLEESFAPIVAYGPHGAIVHYEPTEQTDIPVGKDAFLLMDTGGHYRFGTTDTTRTWHFGQPSPEEKRDYTLVLQGMIRLSMARFPKGTRGAQLDMLARQPLMRHGMMFMHGTGHGVGHVLCVHEGPQSIRLQENPVQLQPGMIQSNEPAVYKTDRYGIRIENLLLVVPEVTTEWGDFYAFETLTHVPICENAIDEALLSAQEIEFLRNYQHQVCQRLKPRLTEDEMIWLQAKVRS